MDITIVKIGGNLIDNNILLSEFLTSISSYVLSNKPIILVHGGGLIANTIADSMGISYKMHNGKRITNKEMLEISVMVYAGSINKQITAALCSLKCSAIGLCGADNSLILSERRPIKDIDYGYVGDIVSVNTSFLLSLLSNGIIPVISSITMDISGQLLNTNADTIASTIGIELQKHKDVTSIRLITCFDKIGVLEDIHDNKTRIDNLSYNRFLELKNRGIIDKGMIPKLDSGFKGIHNGINSVIITSFAHIDQELNHVKCGTQLQA